MDNLYILHIVKDIMSKTQHMKDLSFKERITYLNDKLYIDMFNPIKINQHKNYVLFKYRPYVEIINYDDENLSFGQSYQNFWNIYNGLYRTLRSIVIDVDKLQIVLYPFDKFFNINELDETSIDNIRERINKAHNVEFTDKLDGSLQSARYYDNEIIMCGSEAVNPQKSWRLQTGYDMINSNENLQKALKENPQYTFIFESLTKEDAHVVNYTENDYGLHLIGLRDMNTYWMLPYKDVIEFAHKYNLMTTELFDMSFDEIMSSLDNKKSNEKEGFVANIDGYYVKIKYSDYVHIHKILSKLSSINLIIQKFADGEIDDLYSKVPAIYHKRIDIVISIIKKYINDMNSQIDGFYQKYNHLPIKEYSLEAQKVFDKKMLQFAISRYKNGSVNYIKCRNGRYRKLREMGISEKDYLKIFEEE